MKKIIKKIICLVFPLMFGIAAKAQTEGVSIKTTASAPHGSAMLDIESTTKGLLIPRVPLSTVITSSAPISQAPADGLLIYNTSASTPGGTGFYYWHNSTWNKLSGLWDLDPAATPTTATGIYRKGVVTVGQSTQTVAATSPLTSTLMVYGPSVFYAQAAAPTGTAEYGVHIGEPNGHRGVANGHANEINSNVDNLDLQFNSKMDVTVGAYGGSNLRVYSGSTPTNSFYGNIVADRNIIANGYVVSTSGIVLASDSTLKKNFTACTEVLSKVLNLNTYYYNYTTESDDAQKHIGIIAQQAQRQYPQLVRDVIRSERDLSGVADGGKNAVVTTTTTKTGVDYPALTALLLQAIKEQQAQIEDLKTRVTTLEHK